MNAVVLSMFSKIKISHFRSMKKSIISMLVLAMCSTASVHAQYFEVWIHQYNKQVPIQNNVVNLESAPFEIVIYMSEPMGVRVAASFNNEIYNLAGQRTPVDQLLPFQEGRTMPSISFNTGKELEIDDEAHNYYYYESDDMHSFDNILPYEKGGFHTYRMIENIYSNEGKFTAYEMAGKNVYLVFLLSKWNEDKQDEIRRQGIILSFR